MARVVGNIDMGATLQQVATNFQWVPCCYNGSKLCTWAEVCSL